MNKITLYSRASIFVFSLLLTGVGGALILGYNLRAVGKSKVVVPLVLISLLANAALGQLVKIILPGVLYTFFIPNVITGLILTFPVWNNYLGEITSYNSKKPWIPLLVVVALYGGFTFLRIINK